MATIPLDAPDRRNALTPCYGMAEATLFVAARGKSGPPAVRHIDTAALQRHRVEHVAADDAKGLAVVSCGRAVEQEVAIVDPHTCRRCEPTGVGEIWVRGASVAQGYWNNPRDSAATFEARLADSGDDPYLRTGDMGFIHDGELFITGRVKDLIVIGGRNYYPTTSRPPYVPATRPSMADWLRRSRSSSKAKRG